MKTIYTVKEFKAQFSKLLRRVETGTEITITKRGVPVARLVSVRAQKRKRQLGFYKEKFTVPDDFDAPLPDEILDAFEGRTRRIKKRIPHA